MKGERIKAWVTKYALMHGILAVEGELIYEPDAWTGENTEFLRVVFQNPCRFDLFRSRDWHRTEAEAIHRAEAMRDEEIARLHQRIDNLIALKIEVRNDT